VILGQKMTINHPSLVDEGEKPKVLVTVHKRERREKNQFILKYEFASIKQKESKS